MKVLMITPIKLVQSIIDVLRSVRVNNIEEDGEAEGVGCVDEGFEVFGGTCAWRRG
jgi:hypothetical protein